MKPLRITLDPIAHIDQRITVPYIELSKTAHEIRIELSDGHGLPRHLFISEAQAKEIAAWINAAPSSPLNSPLLRSNTETEEQ